MRLYQTVEQLQDISAELSRLHMRKRLRRILRLILIGFLIGKGADKRISELTKKRNLILKNVTKFCAQSLDPLKRRIEEIESSGTYLIYVDKEQCIATIKLLEADFTYLDDSKILDPIFVSTLKEELERIRRFVLDYNKKFVEQRKKDYSYLWKKGLLSLDEEQQEAIITDDKHNLVVAAAGSGKTEVLITRIAYLIARKPDGVRPNRVLAIAYQKKDVRQIEQRLRERYGIKGVSVRTFHRLGLDILENAGEMKGIRILDPNERPRMIRRIYEEKLKAESDFYSAFLRYVKSLHDTDIIEDAREKEETLAMKKALPYTGVDNTRVKSRAEKEILDFFLTTKLNGLSVQIEYEPEIEELGRPDFYLPEYDLFIEHWGLDEKGEVPKWFDQSTEDYRENMERKRLWLTKNDKLLVETFAYEYNENNPEGFIELLKKKVIEKLQGRYYRSFEFNPMAYEEVLEVAWAPDRDRISKTHVSKDIFNFIKNAKTYNITPTRILQKLNNGNWSRKQYTFGHLAVIVYESYEEELRKLKKIDFEDMINKAIHELNGNRDLYAHVYDHILIDEYQDISAQRYKLIKSLLSHNPKCKLFCVGDDWQNIMGFAGSNLEFFVNFDKYFENPAITKISTNYRSVGTIVEAGRDLIRNNGSCQIPKTTVSNRQQGNLIKVLESPHKRNYQVRYHEQIATDCLNRLIEYKQKGYAPGDILILSRFMRTHTHKAPKFHPVVRSFLKNAKETGIEIAPDNPKVRSKIRLLTVHKSKGLEARVVLVLNVIEDLYGFPCEIEDPAIYAPARENYPPQDLIEEERRLFYVAMTRAKEDLLIYTWESAKSGFIEEINKYTEEIRLYY
ncbi:MAG: UvrD-helicase domain-containing protein [Candidatus Bathyarchaeota archaeon]|nr:UvrD-helicase domain-containing protein [Candidatus Bathyarchaeota archaeon]